MGGLGALLTRTGVVRSVLIVDDDPPTLRALRRLFESSAIAVHTAKDRASALVVSREHPIDLCIVDVLFGGGAGDAGLELVRALHDERPELRLFLSTAYGSIEVAGGHAPRN